MNYGKIKHIAIEDGIGCRVALYVSGCTRHCPGCHNPEAQAFDFGQPFDADTQEAILLLMEPKWIAGLSILGGEPLEDENWQTVGKLCEVVKAAYPRKTIWLYTGKTWEECLDYPLIHFVDVLVDGEYIQEQRDISLRFRGSKNQRLIDVPKSLQAGKVVEWDG